MTDAANESHDMPQHDHHQHSARQLAERNAAGIDRRAFLAAGAAATVLAASHPGFAQNQRSEASAQTSQAAMPDTVKLDRLDGSILLIGIDREKAQNRIDPATFIGLGRAYYLLDHDEALRVGVLYARGPDFSTGLDPAAWEPFLRGGRFNPGTREFIDPVGTVPPRREKPLVVAVQGKTLLAGHELFLAADVRVAARDSVFNQKEVTRGHFPAGGATITFVRESGWGTAMRYMLTGDEWGADEAYRIGLVQYVTPAGQQLDRAIEVARKIAAAAPLGVRATLGSAHRALSDGQEAAYAGLFAELGRLAQSDDHQEYFRALQEKRAPAFRGR
jgi:enoyl-CoA hydratase/carnithine racemase